MYKQYFLESFSMVLVHFQAASMTFKADSARGPFPIA